MKPENVLAIESAISGGSIALIAHGSIVQKWHSAEKVARSEEVLTRIADLLDRTETKKESLSRIAVSNGPGSYTGTRIGLATAMGLARAIQIPCIGVSLHRAVADASEIAGRKIVVVPIGRGGYCWQRFSGTGGRNEPETIGSGNLVELVEFLTDHSNVPILAQSDALDDLRRLVLADKGLVQIIDVGRDLAVAVGLSAALVDDGLLPFYARDIPISPGHGVSG